MAEETQGTEVQPQGTGDSTSAGGGADGAGAGDNQVAELQRQVTTLQSEKAELEQRAKGASEADILRTQLTELRPQAEANARNEAALKAMVDSQIGALPENLQTIAKALPGDVADQAQWLSTSLPTLQQHLMPNTDAAAGGGGRGRLALTASERESMDRANKAGLEFKDEAEFRQHQERAKGRAGVRRPS